MRDFPIPGRKRDKALDLENESTARCGTFVSTDGRL